MLFLCLNLFCGHNHSFTDFITPFFFSDFISNYSAYISTMTIYSLHPQGLFISYPFFINSSFSFPYSLLSLHFHLTVSISLLGLSSELFASGNISLTLILYRTYLGECCALLIPMPASLMTVFPTIL